MKNLAVLSASIALVSLTAAQAADKITYNDHILPLFKNTCLNCHNPDKKKAGLDLSTYQGALQGSENGKVLESGNPAGSLLFKCVKQTDDPKMPPKGDKLNDNELALIEKWIAGQLLETATGKAIAASNNNVQVAVVSLSKPDGPPPMPGELPLEPVVRTRVSNALVALAASPWAPLVAVGGQKQIVLYNTQTLEPLGVLPFPEGFPAIIRFSRNGQLLLTGGGLGGKSGKVVLWDIKTGDRVATLGNEFDQVLAADLSADQQFVALGGPNKLVKIYATKDGKLVTSIKKHTDWVTAIAFSPDGKYLASADRNGGIQVWEGTTGKEFNALPGHKSMVTSLAFMPGVLASSSEDGKVALWDVKEGKEIRNWAAHAGGVEWVDFTADGRLVSCGRDKIAKAWDQNGKSLGASTAFGDIALRAALSENRIVAGDWTGQIRVCGLDGKIVGEITANPPTLSDRIADATKRLSEAQGGLPALQQQMAAAEEKIKADAAALEALKALPAQLEKKLADQSAELDQLGKARDAASESDRPAAQQKVDAQKNTVAATQTELNKAKADLQTRLAAATAPKAPTPAPAPAPAPAAPATNPKADQLAKKLEKQTTEVAKLREIRATKTEGSPEYDEANARVQAKKAEIAQTQEAIDALPQTPATAAAPAAPAKPPAATPPSKPLPAEEEFAKAKAALDQSQNQITEARSALERWKLAQLFQTAYNAKSTLAEKQAQFEALTQSAKDALQPIAQIESDIAAAEKAAVELPQKLKEKEEALAQVHQVADPATKALADAEAAVVAKEGALKKLVDSLPKGEVDRLAKVLEDQGSALAQLREARNALTKDTPEWQAAQDKLTAKRNEMTQTQTALDAAKAGPKPDSPEMKSALGELAQAKDAREKAKLEARTNAVKLAAAEKETAQLRTAAEQAPKKLAELKTRGPQVTKEAQSAKVEAERAAAAAEKDLAVAKSQAEKLRAEYESVKGGGMKSASLTLPNSKF